MRQSICPDRANDLGRYVYRTPAKTRHGPRQARQTPVPIPPTVTAFDGAARPGLRVTHRADSKAASIGVFCFALIFYPGIGIGFVFRFC
jgi:hypothetical protein